MRSFNTRIYTSFLRRPKLPLLYASSLQQSFDSFQLTQIDSMWRRFDRPAELSAGVDDPESVADSPCRSAFSCLAGGFIARWAGFAGALT